MDDITKYKEKYESDKKIALDLFNRALEEYEQNRFDEYSARKLIDDIENLEDETRNRTIEYIGNKKYWCLFKSYPHIFKKYLLMRYENGFSTYYIEDSFLDQLFELNGIALEILETIFDKYQNDDGGTDHGLSIRGKTSRNLGKIGEAGQNFLMECFINGNEHDKYCALRGLHEALFEDAATEHKKIIELLKSNLKNEYQSVRSYCFWMLSNKRLASLEDIYYALNDPYYKIREYAVKALFRLGISKATAKALAVALEDQRREITDLVLLKLGFDQPHFIKLDEDNTDDSIVSDDIDKITSTIVEELVVRSSGRPKEIFNSKIVASALEKLFVFNPQAQSKTLYQLCEIAFQHKGSIRNRAIFVGGLLDKGEFAALVKERVDDNPNDAKFILEIAGASLDTSSIANRISETDPKDIQQNAANQIKLLEKYHEDGLQQAKTSFMWALILSIISLFCLIFTLYLLMTSDSTNIANILTAVGTIFSQFLAGTQFYLYNQTRKQLTYYHQQMNQIQKFLLANSVAESLEGDAKEKSRMELVRLIATMDQVRDIPTKQ